MKRLLPIALTLLSLNIGQAQQKTTKPTTKKAFYDGAKYLEDIITHANKHEEFLLGPPTKLNIITNDSTHDNKGLQLTQKILHHGIDTFEIQTDNAFNNGKSIELTVVSKGMYINPETNDTTGIKHTEYFSILPPKPKEKGERPNDQEKYYSHALLNLFQDQRNKMRKKRQNIEREGK